MNTMQSILLVSKQEKARNEYSQKLCATYRIHHFDIVTIGNHIPDTNEKKKKEKLSIGIKEIRELQEKLFQKPTHGEKKAVIIKNAQTITHEAQNALLKTLEEPPLHTIMLLEATSRDAFLPTVLSRCSVIILEEAVDPSPKKREQVEEFLQSLPTMPIGDKLKLAQDIAKEKDAAIQWLEMMLHGIEKHLIHQPEAYSPILTSLQKTHTVVTTTNSNLRLALEQLLLMLQIKQ